MLSVWGKPEGHPNTEHPNIIAFMTTGTKQWSPFQRSHTPKSVDELEDQLIRFRRHWASGTRVFFAKKICIVLVILCGIGVVSFADGTETPAPFLEAKTIFQTNEYFDPRIGIAVDAVMVHPHGGRTTLKGIVSSWRQHGFPVGRMFFADSDAANEYWTGKWDGTPHPEDVERDAKGDVIKCSGVRPYMNPTEGWIRYLEAMALASLEAGVSAIVPEEPLAHLTSGYESSFRTMWQQRYGQSWQPESASHEARFMTAQLKNELYIQLEQRLLKFSKWYAIEHETDVTFVVPIHSIYSNIAAELIAPLGTSSAMGDIDGYIGQIWTGPVNWALMNYESTRKSFFCSAYVLYDYFSQLAVGNGKKLWLLIDPVEDNVSHTWQEFAQWYRHCVAAMLLVDEVDSYEVMPWPDRIFLPGYGTGGGTPAPEDYRIVILAVTQVLQEIRKGGQWYRGSDRNARREPMEGVGVAVADTLMWETEPFPKLQGMYGMLMPLVERGIPVSSFVMERSHEPAYAARFKTIVLSYESWKPLHESMNTALVEWVRHGGVLIVLGREADELDAARRFWWHNAGFGSPLEHLLSELGGGDDSNRAWPLEKGWVIRRRISPRQFAEPDTALKEYAPLIDMAVRKAGETGGLEQPGYFCMRRGPFIIGHAELDTLTIHGKLIDIFDPNLPARDGVQLSPGSSGIYRDVTDILHGKHSAPCVLHTTHRLMKQNYEGNVLRFTIRGPAGTPAVIRFFPAGKATFVVRAYDSQANEVQASLQNDGETYKLRVPNDPRGVSVKIRFNGGGTTRQR